MAVSAEYWLNTTSKVSHKENLRLPYTCQGCFRVKNADCIQHPMLMWPGLYWTKR